MSTPKLFQPIKIANITLKHRVVLAPMTRSRVTPSDAPVPGLVKEYYAQRGSTPGTLLVTEGLAIAPKAHGFPGLPVFWTDEQINGWKEIVDAVHAKGSFIFLQILALGRGASKEALQAHDPTFEVIGAGDIPYTGGDKPRPLTHEEIREYIDLYAQAAKSGVEKVGFDGVEIHGCNSDLVEQFLEDVSNNRTDEYGGSVENRARFVLEVVGAVGKAIGIEKTALRLSPWPTFFDMGMKDPVPTYSYLVEKLKELYPNLAYLGVIEPRARGGDFEERELEQGESNEFIQKIWSPRPLVLAGGYTRQTAIEKVESAEGVLIAFGRHFLANPDLPVRLEKDAPLNRYDRSTFYVVGSEPKGYTDYPFAS
ncbi:FMN-linked oxidoreductase [Dendrothele bispora CBS 962.96]|uniref:FMN-linked oxidoreductase n=1 Tax=Dendrothele bispora (strain CBS 962.96) TaxID=1314807 RepID=A0A4S8LEY2_DENBC|nr:FMN-linked oxidoreductase [Dendrothele bispora CBS 962.96]